MSGGAFRLRLATPDDARAVAAIYAPFVRDTAVSFEQEPPDEEEMRRRMASTLDRTPWLVVEGEDRLAGYAYAGPFRARPAYQWTTEATVYVDAGFRRRGVGQSLYTALLDALRAMGYRSAVGVVTLPNPASVALHEGLGFRPAGVVRAAGFKLGAWHDVGFWQVELKGPEPPEAPPLTVAELVGRQDWTAALAHAQARLRG
jgi:phosphinothricin acetyltransferase